MIEAEVPGGCGLIGVEGPTNSKSGLASIISHSSQRLTMEHRWKEIP
jgi:hypothetical protein